MSDVKNSGLATDLVSYWELEEASGTRIDSHGSYDLTDINTVGSATGIQGNSASFVKANSEQLSYPSNLALDIVANSDKTIAFWVKTAVDTGFTGLVQRWTIDKGYLIRLSDTDGSLQFYGGNGSGTTLSPATGTTDLADNNWHFVVCTHDGSDNRKRIYIDGNTTPEGTSIVHSTQAASSGAFLLSGGGSSSFLDGQLDEVGVWDRLLTSGEITTLYNSGAGIPYDAGGAVTANLSARRQHLMMM